MRLPNAANAVVDSAKIAEYLLSDTHAEGQGKARFFCSFGFTKAHPEILRLALLQIVQNNEVSNLQTSAFGTKYIVEGPLHAPDGRAPLIRTVWIANASGQDAPRFVTAYPLRGQNP